MSSATTPEETYTDSLLRTLGTNISRYKASLEERSKVEAPKFDPFIYIQPDEIRLSRIIADLLDPRGSHAQGTVFLRSFLKATGLNGLEISDSVRVRREKVTDALQTSRRIDIVISGIDWIVGMENKPWALDQSGQVMDYLDELRRHNVSRFHLLYATRSGTKPAEASIPAKSCDLAINGGELVLLKYRTVVEWLEECRQSCQAGRVTWFLTALIDYINRELLGEIPREAEKMIVETLLDSNPHHLTAALEIIRSREALRSELKTRLMHAIESQLPSGWSIQRNIATQGALGLKLSRSHGWHFCVEPQRKEIMEWCYGVKYDDEATRMQERSPAKLAEALRAALPGVGRTSEWWPYWRWFQGMSEHEPREYEDWESNIQPWLDMSTGTMARNFLALAKQVEAATEE